MVKREKQSEGCITYCLLWRIFNAKTALRKESILAVTFSNTPAR